MNNDIQALEVRRDELKGRIEAIHRDLGRGLEKDYEEQAIQLIVTISQLFEAAGVLELERDHEDVHSLGESKQP